MYFFLRLKPNILCSGNLCTFSSSYILGSCNGEGKGHSPNNIIDHKGLAVACDVMQLVTGVWSILIQALSELLGNLKEKKVWEEQGGFTYKGRDFTQTLSYTHFDINFANPYILSLSKRKTYYVCPCCLHVLLSVSDFVCCINQRPVCRIHIDGMIPVKTSGQVTRQLV